MGGAIAAALAIRVTQSTKGCELVSDEGYRIKGKRGECHGGELIR